MLEAKEFNVNSLLREEGEDSAPPSRAAHVLSALGEFVASEGAPAIRADIKFTTPSLFLGAETLDEVSLALSSAPGEPLRGTIETGLPGRGHVKLDGAYEFGAAAEFRGAIEANVADIGALGQWAATRRRRSRRARQGAGRRAALRGNVGQGRAGSE